MSTKTKLKARRMWANPAELRANGNRLLLSRVKDNLRLFGATARVAVIPLDGADDISDEAFEAFWKSEERGETPRDCMRAALTAIGILPKQRKTKGRK